MEPIPEWDEFLADGDGFLQAAKKGLKRKEVFTPVILYNLVAMAIEKFVMAALMKRSALPYNHTMVDLVEALEAEFPGRFDEVREQILALDKYQEICDPWDFSITPPREEEIPKMISLAEDIRKLLEL